MPDNPQINLVLLVTNEYPELNEAFQHKFVVSVPAPDADSDADELGEWASEHLLAHTGEGDAYANTYGSYTVEILGGPSDRPELIGLVAFAEG